MSSSKPVAINVGGKLYHTGKETLELYPDTLIGMLYRQRAPDNTDPIFVDRDHKLFRWILYWHRTGILLDHNAANVPLEVWNDELSFYGITTDGAATKPLGDAMPKKRKLLAEEQALREKAQKIAGDYEQNLSNRQLERRREYARFFDWFLTHFNKDGDYGLTGFDFVGKAEGKSYYAGNYGCDLNLEPVWLKEWFSEFAAFCADMGYIAKCASYSGSTTTRKYKFTPASRANVPGSLHSTMQIHFGKMK